MEPIRPAKREELRPDPGVTTARELSSRELAELRAKEVMDARNKHSGDENDKFYVRPDAIPDGWTYQWCRHSLIGMDLTSHQVGLAMAGWSNVPAGRHPEMMPIGTPPDSGIIRDGLILMERPLVLSEQQHRKNYNEAVARVSDREQKNARAPAGDGSPFDSRNNGDSLVKQRRSFGAPMAIPD